MTENTIPVVCEYGEYDIHFSINAIDLLIGDDEEEETLI